MAEGGSQRRLAAIVAIDVAGYSRLMGADEQGTLDDLKAHRDAMTPLVAQHDGRLVGTAGDGLLLEFPSVVEAVTCAIAVQAAMAMRNQDVPDDKKMLYRIGINLGDVLVEDDDIFGDGVNVAARIEALAEPGGICLSHTVHDQIRDRMDVALEDKGEIEVKNIARPVRVFRVLAKGVAAGKLTATARPLWQSLSIVAVLAFIIIAGGGTWWWQQQPDFEPADPAKITLKLPDKPSIAVLPFANMSGDKEQDYFADGISEDLTTQLSKISGLMIISRTSTFAYKGKSLDVRKIARDLGVRYILEGSVRRGGDQLRINAQLIDATTGGHLWAEVYEGPVGDVFALQDRINKNIVSALKVRLSGDEPALVADRGTTNIEAYEAFLQAERLRRYSGKNVFGEAAREYVKAIALDPDFADAHAGLGHALFSAAEGGDMAPVITLGKGKDEERLTLVELWARAEVEADRSLKITERPLGLLLRAKILLKRKWKHEQALSAVKRAIELDPNSTDGHAFLAELQLYSGQAKDAMTSLKSAMQLDPGYPIRYSFLLGQIKFHQGQYQAALDDISKFCETAFAFAYNRLCIFYQAAAYAYIGDMKEARKTIKDIEHWGLAGLESTIKVKYPFKDPGYQDSLIKGLAKAFEE